MKRITLVCTAALLCLLVAGGVGVWNWLSLPNEITISPATTHLTEPLDENGDVDYVAFVNAKYSQGVTLKNNAMRTLAETMRYSRDFADLPESAWQRFLAELGIDSPETGPKTLTGFEHFVATLEGDVDYETLDQQYAQATSEPWRSEQFPQIAAWLKLNEQPVELALEACRKERFHCPAVIDKPGLRLFAGQLVTHMKEVESLLLASALRHAGEGRTDRALDELLAMKRLGRLASHDWSLLGFLLSDQLERSADAGVGAVAKNARITSAQLQRYQQGIAQLPPRGSLADVVDEGVRYAALDMVCSVARGEIELYDIDTLHFRDNVNPQDRVLDSFLAAHVADFDVALTMTNEYYDQLVAALREPDMIQRKHKIDAFDEQFFENAIHTKRKGTPEYSKPGLGAGLGELVAQEAFYCHYAGPEVLQLLDTRAKLSTDIAIVEMALSAYKNDHGAYPHDLTALTPEYIDEIPADPFTKRAPLRYAKLEDGYRLYSVGLNGLDDEGRGEEVYPPGDDLLLSMP